MKSQSTTIKIIVTEQYVPLVQFIIYAVQGDSSLASLWVKS